MDDNPTFTEDPLGMLVHFADRYLSKRLQRNFKSQGYEISAEQWRVLVHLWRRDGQTLRRLSEKTGKDKGNITRLVDGLENKNIVVRMPNPDDGRSKRIYLTATGKSYQAGLVPIARATLLEARANIPQEAMVTCMKVLGMMIRNLASS